MLGARPRTRVLLEASTEIDGTSLLRRWTSSLPSTPSCAAGEPYELCRVEREVRGSDAFKNINPRGQVPALRVGDRTLVEADAILVHLAEAHERQPATGIGHSRARYR